jgi:hypothetical protein
MHHTLGARTNCLTTSRGHVRTNGAHMTAQPDTAHDQFRRAPHNGASATRSPSAYPHPPDV